MTSSIVNAMSVDVEDYFQVSAFESRLSREDWHKIPSRLEGNVDRILGLFDAANVRATFFTLGWIAERYPTVVKRISDSGHEIASHGWEHARVSTQTPKRFRDDISRTRKLLEDVCGEPVVGYRAASFSIGPAEVWAWNEMAEAGYLYSSSVVPINHDHYGLPEASRFQFRVANERILEIPVTTISLVGRNINCGGGGWFRLFPYSLFRRGLRHVNQNDNEPCVFYFHPWEIDPDQPRLDGLEMKTRFRHYLNLGRMQSRLERLLTDFSWDRMDRIFLEGSTSK